MNKSESKYFNTARLMDEALLRLLEKKDFPYITVQELCRTAGVNRSTFYLHYDSTADLLAETLSFINERFLASFSQKHLNIAERIATAPLEELIFINQEYLLPYLGFIKEYKTVFQASISQPQTMGAESNYANLKTYILQPVLKRFGVPKEKWNYVISFYVHGSTAIVNEWVKNNCKEGTESIAQTIIDCIRPHDKWIV